MQESGEREFIKERLKIPSGARRPKILVMLGSTNTRIRSKTSAISISNLKNTIAAAMKLSGPVKMGSVSITINSPRNPSFRLPLQIALPEDGTLAVIGSPQGMFKLNGGSSSGVTEFQGLHELLHLHELKLQGAKAGSIPVKITQSIELRRDDRDWPEGGG